MSVTAGKPANRLLRMMKNLVFPLLVLVLLSACATSTDKEYIRCLQGFNDPSTGAGIPGGKAASVIGAGTVGERQRHSYCAKSPRSQNLQIC